LNGYYSVFDPTGKKIADCGSIKDTVNLIRTRGDGHYYQFNPIYETVDVQLLKRPELPTRDIVVDMDGGVGGSWKEVSDEEFDKLFVSYSTFQNKNNSLKINNNL